jgi:hypothetical protein
MPRIPMLSLAISTGKALGLLPTARSTPWMPVKALPFSLSMGNPRLVEVLVFLVFPWYLYSLRECWSLEHLESLWKSFTHTCCLLCLGNGSSRRLRASQPEDSGGKYPETLVRNPSDSGVDDLFPPIFQLLLMLSSSRHVCLSPMLSYPLFHKWFSSSSHQGLFAS